MRGLICGFLGLPLGVSLLAPDAMAQMLPVTFWVGSNHSGSIIKLEPVE